MNAAYVPCDLSFNLIATELMVNNAETRARLNAVDERNFTWYDCYREDFF